MKKKVGYRIRLDPPLGSDRGPQWIVPNTDEPQIEKRGIPLFRTKPAAELAFMVRLGEGAVPVGWEPTIEKVKFKVKDLPVTVELFPCAKHGRQEAVRLRLGGMDSDAMCGKCLLETSTSAEEHCIREAVEESNRSVAGISMGCTGPKC